MPFAFVGAAVAVAGAVVTGVGQAKSASAQKKAASTNKALSDQNAQITENQTNINLVRQQRAGFQVQGAASADVASSNLKASGSALDVLRSSASQIALDRSLIASQGNLEKSGWTMKAADYQGQAKSAQAAKWGAVGGAMGSAGSALLGVV